MLVSDIINGAFEDLGVISVNETITTAMQSDAFLYLNPLLDQVSAEGLGVPSQVMQSFPLFSGVVAYTFGPSGTWATTGGLQQLKVTAWRAASSDMLRGGPALRMDEFGIACTQAQKDLIAANVAAILQSLDSAAKSILALPVPPTLTELSTAFPNANVRVWPPPSAAPGSVELAYTTPLVAFAAVGSTVTLPPGGWLQMLRWNLARELYSRYPSPSRQKLIWERADATKDILRAQAAMPARSSETQPQPDPQQQQAQQ